MTNEELIDKIREEILHLKMKELQRTNGINTGADVYLSSYAVLSILSNALTEESEDDRIRKVIFKLLLGMREEIFTSQDEIVTKEKVLAYLEKKPDIKIWPHPIKDAYLEQKEQKPAWSEEDERRIDAICELLENTSAIHPNYSRRELIIWLKSLRPSWKPNEEQMNALNFAITYMFSTKANPTVLRDLYDDLLKLK